LTSSQASLFLSQYSTSTHARNLVAVLILNWCQIFCWDIAWLLRIRWSFVKGNNLSKWVWVRNDGGAKTADIRQTFDGVPVTWKDGGNLGPTEQKTQCMA